MITSIKLLTKDEELTLLNFEYVKKIIKNRIVKDKALSELESAIDNSKIFNFKNNKVRIYISRAIPLFILKFDASQLRKSGSRDISIQDLVSQAFFQDIIKPYTNYLMSYVYKNNEKEKILINETISTYEFLIATLFDIFVDEKNNVVYIEYIL